MQKQNLVQLEIESILFDLSYCIDNLNSFMKYLSVEDVHAANKSLKKLSEIITEAQYQKNYRDFLLNN